MPTSTSSQFASRSRTAPPIQKAVGEVPGEFVLLNAQRVDIRPIEPSDGAALTDFHDHLSTVSIHNRFFGAHPHLTLAEANSFATVDRHRRMAFVALIDGTVIGVGRYEGINNQTAAEAAFIVADDLQGQGLGTIFLGLLVEHARANGYTKFVAQILASNSSMREVFARSGLSPLFRGHMGVIDVVLDLDPEPKKLDERTRANLSFEKESDHER